MSHPSGVWIFVGLVFLAAFLLAQSLTIPVFGESRRMHKRLRARPLHKSSRNFRPRLAH